MGVFLLVVGIICIVYGATIMLTWSGTAFFLVWYVLGIICGGTGALALALPDSTVVRGIRTAVCCLTICGIAIVSVMSAVIMREAYRTPPRDLDYLIVLGAQVRPSGKPSEVLRYRLVAARDYLDENPRTRVVVSGGQGPNEPCPEGEAMARWLERAGVDAERIIVESASKTTVENLQNSRALIDDDDARIGIVTNNFHLFRAMRMAERLDIKHVWGHPSPFQTVVPAQQPPARMPRARQGGDRRHHLEDQRVERDPGEPGRILRRAMARRGSCRECRAWTIMVQVGGCLA